MAENTSDALEGAPCVNPQNLRITDGLALASILYMTILFLVLVVSLGLWFRKRDEPYLLKRTFFPDIVLLTVSGILNLISSPLMRATAPAYRDSGFKDYSLLHDCVFFSITYNLIIPVLLTVQFVRIYQWLQNVKYNEKLSQIHVERQATGLISRWGSTSEPTEASARHRQLYELTRLKVMTGTTVKYYLTIFLLVLGLCFAFIPAAYSCPALGVSDTCRFESSTVTSNFALFLNLFPLSLFLGFFVYMRKLSAKYPDPFGILKEIYESFLVGMCIAFVGLVLIAIDPWDVYNEDKSLKFDYAIIVGLGMFAFLLNSISMPVYRVYTKDRREIVSKTSLKEFLASEAGRKLFRMHLVYEFSVENINFYETILNWRAHFRSQGNEVNIATNVFRNYISDEAVSNQVNLSHEIKQEIRDRIAVGNVTATIFDDAAQEIFDLMESDSFRRFVRTSTYRDFVGDNFTPLSPGSNQGVFESQMSPPSGF